MTQDREMTELANGLIALCNHSDLPTDEVIRALAYCIGAAVLSASKDVPVDERSDFYQEAVTLAGGDIAQAIIENVISKEEPVSVADLLGFGPKRVAYREDSTGMVVVEVTAPPFVNPKGKSVMVRMTQQQYEEGYKAWRNGALIQDAMPFLSASNRDKLITGL